MTARVPTPLRRLASAATSIALLASGLTLTAPAASAAMSVVITSPAAAATGITPGVPFEVTATVSDAAKTVALSATGCVFSPASFTDVTAGSEVTSAVICSAAAKTATISVKATDTATPAVVTTATRLVTFATTQVTPTLTAVRADLPICNGSGSYSLRLSDPSGDPVYGVKITGTVTIPATATTAAITRTVSATTKSDGAASFNTSLVAGATMTLASAVTGVWRAATISEPIALTPDTCGVVTSFTSTQPANATYKTAVTVTGKVELERTTDSARTPLASQPVVIKVAGRTVATATTNELGVWSKSVQLSAGGVWTATATSTAAGLSPAADTATGGETTVDAYAGTLTATLDTTKFANGFTAGDSVPTAITLTATDPNTGSAAAAAALKSIPVKGSFALAGSTGLRNFGGAVVTDGYGKAKITGRILGNGTITVKLNNANGMTASDVTIPVTAAAKVTLVMSGKTAVASSRRSVTVLASPSGAGTATIEYKLATATDWTFAKTATLGQRTTVTMPSAAGSYVFRARVDASTAALAGTSANLAYTVTARTSTTPVQVDDLACVSTAGAAPVCEWTAPTTNSVAQTVTGYTVKVAGTARGSVDASTLTFTLPSTAYKTGVASSVTVLAKVSSGTAIDSPAVTPVVLAAPTNVKATVDGTNAAVTWTAVTGATGGYRVSVNGSAPVTVESTDYTVTDLPAGANTITVTAASLNGDTSAGTEVTASVLAPSVTISAVSTDDSSQVLAVAGVSKLVGMTGFTAECSTLSATEGFTSCAVTAGAEPVTSLTISGLAPGTPYWFKVTPTLESGTASASNVVSATTLVDEVESISIVSASGSSVTLGWTSPNGSAASYALEQSVAYRTPAVALPGVSGLYVAETAYLEDGAQVLSGSYYSPTALVLGSGVALPAVYTYSYFVAKVSASGTWLWARALTSPTSATTTNPSGVHLAAGPGGSIAMTVPATSAGLSVGATFVPLGGTTTATGTVNTAVLGTAVVQLSADGNVMWGRFLPYAQSPSAVTVSPTGQVALVGAGLYSPASVTLAPGITIPGGMSFHTWAAQLTATGAWSWLRPVGSAAGGVLFTSVAFDQESQVVVGGTYYTGTSTLPLPLSENVAVPPSPTNAAFVGRLDSAGAWKWALGLPVPVGYSTVRSVSVSGQGRILIAGDFAASEEITTAGGVKLPGTGSTAAAYVAQLAVGDGQWRWLRPLVAGPGGVSHARAMVATRDGEAVLAGSYTAPATVALGSDVMLPATPPAEAAFVAKLSDSGEWVWARTGGSGDAMIRSVAVNSRGAILIGGHYSSLDPVAGPVALPAGSYRGFLVTMTGGGDWLAWYSEGWTASTATDVTATGGTASGLTAGAAYLFRVVVSGPGGPLRSKPVSVSATMQSGTRACDDDRDDRDD